MLFPLKEYKSFSPPWNNFNKCSGLEPGIFILNPSASKALAYIFAGTPHFSNQKYKGL